MKKLHIAALAVTVAIATTFTVVSIASANTEELVYERMHEPVMQKALADLEVILYALGQEIWLQRLIQCESGGNPRAINPNDSDGTPSYGLLQFKPATFRGFSKQYGIEGTLMEPEAQKAIVRRMINDPAVKLHNQFPACTRKLGLPPVM